MRVLESITLWVVKFCERIIKWHGVAWKSDVFIPGKSSKRTKFSSKQIIAQHFWSSSSFETAQNLFHHKNDSQKKTSETQNWSFITTELCQCIITGLCGASLQTFFCCWCQFNDTTSAANHYSFLSYSLLVALIKCRIFKYYWEQALKKHLKFLFTVPKCWKKKRKVCFDCAQKANASFFLY